MHKILLILTILIGVLFAHNQNNYNLINFSDGSMSIEMIDVSSDIQMVDTVSTFDFSEKSITVKHNINLGKGIKQIEFGLVIITKSFFSFDVKNKFNGQFKGYNDSGGESISLFVRHVI